MRILEDARVLWMLRPRLAMILGHEVRQIGPVARAGVHLEVHVHGAPPIAPHVLAVVLTADAALERVTTVAVA